MHFRNVTVAFALSVVLSLTQGRVAAQTQTVQREIVGHVDGPLLVIAGPGSGKTYSIVLRALNLLPLAKALPRQIVLCTFTEKAAFEMRDRLAAAARKVGYSSYVSCSVYRRVLLGIVPPTEERGTECLEVAGLAPGDIIGIERVRQRPITAEKAAINAVLAGCLPVYMPVVVAVLRAMCDEKYNLHGTSASTGGTAPFIVVNGPVRMLIGMNATHNVLANGNRPNATIGRAIRLALINLLGVIPGEIDRSTLGHPGKFTFCIAEDEENSPWTPLAQEMDIPDGESAVTVLAAGAPRQVMNEWTHDPEEILETFAAEMRHNMLTYSVF